MMSETKKYKPTTKYFIADPSFWPIIRFNGDIFSSVWSGTSATPRCNRPF